MVIPKINSAHGSDTQNIINRAIEVLNQLGINVQDLVAKGQLTPTQYAELLREVNSLIAKGEVKLDDLDPEVLEALNNGSGTPFEILSIPRDGSVSPEKTTFLKKTSNLFNGEYLPYVLVTLVDGGMRIRETLTGEKGGLAIIPVSPNTTYTVKSHDLDNTDAFRIGLSDGPLEFSDFGLFNLDKEVVQGDDIVPERFYTFTTGANTNFAYVYASKTGKSPRIQFQRGSNADTYEPPYVLAKEYGLENFSLDKESVSEVHIRKEAVTPEKTTFFEKGNNLFDGSFFPYAMQELAGGILRVDENHNIEKGGFIMLSVKPSTTYTIKSHDVDKTDAFRIGLSENPLTFTDFGLRILDVNVLYGDSTVPEREYTFTTNASSNYAYFQVSKTGKSPRVQIEEGSVATPYSRPFILKEKYLNINSNEVELINVNKRVEVLSAQEFYDVPPLAHMNDPNGEYKIHEQNSSSMYALYDALMAKYPNYITKILAGKESTGKNIYKYIFEPKAPAIERSGVKTDLLHFFITGGIHGSEKVAWWCLYETMKQICENWKDSNALSKLRWDVKFTVIPIANPYGIDNPTDPATFNGKINSNGVDIYRNFPAGFIKYAEGSVGYGGSEPLSEPEAVIIHDILVNDEIDFYIDFHSFSSQPDPNTFIWLLSNNSFETNMSQKYISQLTQKWKIQDEEFPQSDTDFFGYVSSSTGGNTLTFAESLDIPSNIFEITHTMHPKGITTQYSSEVITLGTEAQLNWIYMNYINLTN